MSVPVLLDSFVEFWEKFQNISLESFFFADYFYCYYIFHVIYIVFNIRQTAYTNGLAWYRSLLLGYTLSNCSRFIFQFLFSITLPDFIGFRSILIFGIIWCLFNVFPFDLIYEFSCLSFNRYLIQILDSFVTGENLVMIISSITESPESNASQTVIISCLSLCSPIIIDFFDRHYIAERFQPMAYQANFALRVIFFVLLVITLTSQNFHLITLHQAQIIIPLSFALLSVIDLIAKNGKSFETIDFGSVKLIKTLISYHPGNNH